MDLVFRTRNPKQKLAAKHWIDNTTEQILYGGAKGGGKSYLGASLIFGDALIYPNTHYFIARKRLIDLRLHTVPTIKEVFGNWGIAFDKYANENRQENFFELYNGSRVYLIACKDEPSDPFFERFGSMQMTRGWIEEGGEIPEAAKANLWLTIGRWKNNTYNLKKKLLITCNPKRGWMKREFIDPHERGVLAPDRVFIQSLPTDNPYLPKDYLRTLSSEKNKVRRQRLWLGRWDYDESENALVSADALEDLRTNTAEESTDKYLIVDVARLGKDTTVFSFWRGLELYEVMQFEKQNTRTTEQKIKDLAAERRIPYSHILVDEDGIGGGVVDHLPGVKGFTANSVPIPTARQIEDRIKRTPAHLTHRSVYSNLKAQCGWKIAEIINERRMAVTHHEYHDIIMEELAALLRAKHVDAETRQLVPKEEVKAELGHSPDAGDTVLMRAYFELLKEAEPNTSINQDEVWRESEVIDETL